MHPAMLSAAALLLPGELRVPPWCSLEASLAAAGCGVSYTKAGELRCPAAWSEARP